MWEWAEKAWGRHKPSRLKSKRCGMTLSVGSITFMGSDGPQMVGIGMEEQKHLLLSHLLSVTSLGGKLKWKRLIYNQQL